MKFAVAGTGHVGFSDGILLAQNSPERVATFNRQQSTIDDSEVADSLANKKLNFRATLDGREVYVGADFVIITTPTDCDPGGNYFNTQSIEAVVRDVLSISPDAVVEIRFAVPVGFTARTREALGTENLMFPLEFLCEGKALYDNIHPSRIVVGERSVRAETFAGMLRQGVIKKMFPRCLPSAWRLMPLSCLSMPVSLCA
jgi:UDPglucose 6-dehydrogenase